MAKKEPKPPKFPNDVYVEWSDSVDPMANPRYLIISEQPTSDENETKQVAVYKFDRIVTVENKTTVKG